LGYHYPNERDPQRLEPVGARKASAFSVMLSKEQSESSTIHLSSTPAIFLRLNHKVSSPIVLQPVKRSILNEPKRVVVLPVERSTSITSSVGTHSHLGDITVGPTSFMEPGRQHTKPV